MRREPLDTVGQDAAEKNRRREALEVLLEARERLLVQMTDEILVHGEGLLDGSEDGLFSFELQEIEDRYSARLNSLNALIEQLEYRQPKIENRVETIRTTVGGLKKDLAALVNRYEQWDLVGVDIVKEGEDQALVVVVFTRDEFPE